jgi:hypothetical protein
MSADQVRAALRGDIISAMRALLPLVEADPAALLSDLRAAVAAEPTLTINAVIASTALDPATCAVFVRALLGDPRATVRRGFFEAFAPLHVAVPVPVVKPVPDPALDEMLRQGLLDPDGGVRTAAARYTFAAARGAQVLGELLVNLQAPEPELRWWVVLALGQARDPLSLDQLEQLMAGDDAAFASAAVRALAARPDGHATWIAAFTDPRPGMRETALFALRQVATGVSDEHLAVLAADPGQDIQDALTSSRASIRSKLPREN